MTLDASTTINMDTNAVDLNFDANTLVIDSSADRLGVGTASPAAKLDVAGAVKISDDSATCASAGDEGKVRYVGGVFEFCESSATGWQSITDIAPAAGGGGGACWESLIRTTISWDI
jgi:hypothetical protein